MRSTKLMGHGLVAALVMAVAASTASAASFHYTGTVPTSLLGEALSTQKFVAGFGTLECKSLGVEAVINELPGAELEVDIAYSNCTSTIGTVKQPIKAGYTLNSNGTVFISAPIELEIEGVCTITVNGGQTLTRIAYGPRAVNLTVTANLENIKWTATGLCGSGSKGTFGGEFSLMGESLGELYVE